MEVNLLQGDCSKILETIPSASVQCVVTSPPYYGLRDYGTAKWEGGNPDCRHLDEYAKAEQERNRKGLARNANELDGGKRLPIVQNGIDQAFQCKDVCKQCGARRIDTQIGLESTPELYVEKLVNVFREVRRVLKDDGTLWLNLGDSYNGSGKGGNPEGSPFTKQKTNQGSLLDRPTRISGLKPKDLIGIPWMVAFALREDGWYLRQDIIWHKWNPMPESVTDRCTKSHEYMFLLTKSRSYFYDFEAILEPANYDGRKVTKMNGSKKYQNGFAPTDENLPIKGHERWSRKIGRTERKLDGTNYGGDGKGLHGHSGYFDKDGNPRFNQFKDGTPARNKRSVWSVPTKPYKEAHFATFPPDLIEPCILAGSKEGDTVLDPFNGAGTTGEVALKHRRNYIGIDLNPDYIELTERRLSNIQTTLLEN